MLSVVLWVALGFVAPRSRAIAAESAARKPNVLLIVSEDNSPNLSCYGDRLVQTPNLDRLASEGVRFERAFVATASCSESRSAILTGLYPHQNGQIGLATHKYAMHRNWPNIPSLLKQHGYRTGIIGKLHVNPESAFPFDFRWNVAAFCSFAHRDVRKIADVAEAFITESDEPFFLMVNYPDAHLPWLPKQDGLPETPLTAADVETLPSVGIDVPRLRACTADYYNCIRRLDSGIGMLLGKLTRAGREDNTLVIYLADHGAQFQRGKLSCYEGGLRVPLIVRWPEHRKEGSVIDELVATVDLLPTILEAVGAEVPAGLAGRSMAPLLQGDAVMWREYLYAEYHSHYPPVYFPQRAVRDGRFKLIVNLLQDRVNPVAQPKEPIVKRLPSYVTPSDLATSSDEVRRAYATWRDAPPVELYDLETDPYEFKNLAGQPQHADVQERLLAQLESWRRKTDDPLSDPAKLAKLTEEQDKQAEKYKTGSRSGAWEYHQYLYGDWSKHVLRHAESAGGVELLTARGGPSVLRGSVQRDDLMPRSR
jgi:N-sulfoglucosamine sulfohydrolase